MSVILQQLWMVTVVTGRERVEPISPSDPRSLHSKAKIVEVKIPGQRFAAAENCGRLLIVDGCRSGHSLRTRGGVMNNEIRFLC